MTDERRHAEILRIVQGARRRWRLRVALRGAALSGAATLGALFLSALLLERLRFDATAVLWLRGLTWGTLLASALWFLARPLGRSVGDRQVALYLEEHEPSLDLALVSALEADGDPGASPALVRRLTDTALQGARRVEGGLRVERPGLQKWGGALTALVVGAIALTLLGPAHLRSGLGALVLPLRAGEPPGWAVAVHARVQTGAGLTVIVPLCVHVVPWTVVASVQL